MTKELKINEEFKEKLISRNAGVLDGVQYLFHFDNNYGASVVKHRGSYGSNRDLWEMALIEFEQPTNNWDLVYANDFKDDVIGYLTDEEVNELLGKIEKY